MSQFLGIGIDEMSQIYVSTLKPEMVGELETAKKANYILRHFDIESLERCGFIHKKASIKEIETRIVSFFELSTIYEYDSEVSGVLFSRSKALSHDKAREFWVRTAYHQFKKINNENDYDSKALESIIPKIRSYTRHEEKGLLTVIRALYSIGITVIPQTYLSKSQIMGATFVVNNKPCIVLTNYNKRYASVWTALMHELYHVLYDLEDLKTWKYHLTGEPDLNLMREDDADFFAQEILVPNSKMDYIKHFINNTAIVYDFAKENKLHPSLIYYFYCKDQEKKGKKLWGLYNDHLIYSDKAFKSVSGNPFDKENIMAEIQEIKKKLTEV